MPKRLSLNEGPTGLWPSYGMGVAAMRTDAMLRRLGGSAMLALALATGGAWAQEAGDEGVPISGEGVEGEVTVTGVDDTELPPGFCDDCEETGEIVIEVLAEGAGSRAEGGFATVRMAKAQAEVNICTSREHYVAWLCEWQGFPKP